jgi:hypothetical protein
MYWPTCEHSVRHPVSISGIIVGVGPAMMTLKPPAGYPRHVLDLLSHADLM